MTLLRRALLLLSCAAIYVTATASAAELPRFSGSVEQLSAHQGEGNWLVVMVWASDCHVCNEEIGNYVTLHKSGKYPRIDLLGVSIDGEAGELDAEAFVERHGVDFPNLLADPWVMMQTYRVVTGGEFIGTPTFMVFAPGGAIKAAQAGGVPARVVVDFIARQSADTPTATN